ncbi:hypothetical protein [Pseudonocardia sp.]|nr:hypothetical protein [Pseudonocardia sp.]
MAARSCSAATAVRSVFFAVRRAQTSIVMVYAAAMRNTMSVAIGVMLLL